ncbi:MAG: antibiotic biosynthesis monooxygenase [Gordonia paraffinivorans]
MIAGHTTDPTSTAAVVVVHRTLPGRRDEVRALWERHMAPAVQGNPGHLAYCYGLDVDDPDVITAFQLYRGADDASAFLDHPAYAVYERAVAPLLTGPPQVRRLTPIWIKDSTRPHPRSEDSAPPETSR